MANLFYLPTQMGSLRPVTEEEHIRYSLKSILLSERQILGNGLIFGSSIRRFLYRPLTTALQLELTQHLKEVISSQETRVELTNLLVASDPFEQSKLLIEFQYLIRGSNKNQTFKLKLTPEGDGYGFSA